MLWGLEEQLCFKLYIPYFVADVDCPNLKQEIRYEMQFKQLHYKISIMSQFTANIFFLG